MAIISVRLNKNEENIVAFLGNYYEEDKSSLMNNRRASPAVSLTYILYSANRIAQAVFPYVFFDNSLDLSLDS